MKNKDLAEWLSQDPSTRDFNQGFAFFQILPGNVQLKRIFALKGDTKYNREKLNYELQKAYDNGRFSSAIAKSNGAVNIPVSAPKAKDPVPEAPNPLKASVADLKSIADLDDEKNKLFREAAYLHDRLDLMKDPSERHQACKCIYWNMQRVNQIHRILNVFKEEGKLLDEPPVGPKPDAEFPEYAGMDLAALISARNNLRTRKSKAKKNPEKLVAITAQLDIVEALIKEKSPDKTQSNK